ncbi:MAG: gamma-butyrobetaine,2-oxoglutarate dioxygenase, partial [Halieaceae bacterium]|nr:gamma-butyrobetaine,2-oxoglutarate dioxygenase [Halieaceae bacterium]
MRKHDVVMEPPVPDFYCYGPEPIAFADWSGDTVVLHWHDGKRLSCHRFWLRENTFGYGGIDPATREGLMDPAELSDAMQMTSVSVTPAGDLRIVWQPDEQETRYHSGWLKH